MPPKIIDYYIVTSSNQLTVINGVQAMIQKGFQPFGSASCSFYKDEEGQTWATFIQAVVRYEEVAK